MIDWLTDDMKTMKNPLVLLVVFTFVGVLTLKSGNYHYDL